VVCQLELTRHYYDMPENKVIELPESVSRTIYDRLVVLGPGAISDHVTKVVEEIVLSFYEEILRLREERDQLQRDLIGTKGPIPMIIACPACRVRHIDTGEWATRVHHTHACQHCGVVWRPAVHPTVGVLFLPGFKNEI